MPRSRWRSRPFEQVALKSLRERSRTGPKYRASSLSREQWPTILPLGNWYGSERWARVNVGRDNMLFEQTPIQGVIAITPKKLFDSRGYFLEAYRADEFEAEVGSFAFVQDNCSYSEEAGTVRGLHFQLSPRAQGKLVWCAAGSLLDVAVDIRIGSPTYGKSVTAELSAKNARQLWIPPGLAHGFCTLDPATVICYKVTEYYSPQHDRGLLWSDPELAIDWPVTVQAAIVSDKDRSLPTLAEFCREVSF